jgi:hypothetical protein
MKFAVRSKTRSICSTFRFKAERHRRRRIPSVQHDVIDYLMDENHILKGQLRGKRLRLTDDERRRLSGGAFPSVFGTEMSKTAPLPFTGDGLSAIRASHGVEMASSAFTPYPSTASGLTWLKN